MSAFVSRKIYVASSWRNTLQPEIVRFLRSNGHEVYDFRNPMPGNHGFAWSQIDPDWVNWTPVKFAEIIQSSPIALDGFRLDKQGLDWCDTCVLVLPCGRSAHLEAGYACGQGKRVIFLLQENQFEPELMYLLGNSLVCFPSDLLAALQ